MVMTDPVNALTPRQLEYLAMAASGYELKEIAEIKFVHYNVVQRALLEAKDRVGAKTLAHLCLLARESGIIIMNDRNRYVPVQEERIIE